MRGINFKAILKKILFYVLAGNVGLLIGGGSIVTIALALMFAPMVAPMIQPLLASVQGMGSKLTAGFPGAA